MSTAGKHLAPYPRRFPLLPAVESVGYIRHKTERVTHTFSGCNFSFILSGSGEYLLNGERIPVLAPCVLLQWPEEPMSYGPPPGGAWEELFLIYPGESRAVFQAANVFSPAVRPFRRTAHFETVLEQWKALCLAREIPFASADAADRLGWELISASFADDGVEMPVDPAWEKLRKKLEGGAEVRLDTLAAELGMSVSTLRRRWRDATGTEGIAAYREAAFLRDGCRMLVETSRSVKEIAAQLGFEDVSYFCRKFRRRMGCAPSEYRVLHRLP